MWRSLIVAVAALAASDAAAQGRPATPGMTCGQARGLLAARGAAVLGTGGMTYDRFVVDRTFCEPTEIVARALVPTRDTPSCFIGYRCKEPSAEDRLGRF